MGFDHGPSGFDWIDRCVGAAPIQGATGCACAPGDCRPGACSCLPPGGELCDREGRFLPIVHGFRPPYDTLRECGAPCGCGTSCTAAATQQPPPRGLALRQLAGKGWGVVAEEPLPAGTFVCEYVGELVSTPEAQRRLQQYDAEGAGHALLVVREVLPAGSASLRTNIDATRRGNLARFLNHACGGGNLAQVVVRRAGSLVPAVALFASRDIEAGEELCYSYGPPNPGPTGKRCCCGTAACLGILPHEDV